MKKIIVKTGGVVPISGQYHAVGVKTEATFVEGKKVPPSNISKKQVWVLVDKTKHQK